MSNEHGYCPHCNADLDGEDIVKTFRAMGKTKKEAQEMASNYGYASGRTKWGRQIGIYSMELDRDIAKRCPDCHKEW